MIYFHDTKCLLSWLKLPFQISNHHNQFRNEVKLIDRVKWQKRHWCFRCSEEEMEKYGIHLLVLSHVYSVPQLKQSCTKVLGDWLTMENVVDVLQLARMCDAPNLYLKCMKLVANNFKAVEKTEGWKFLQEHDPWLELDILHFMDEAELVNYPSFY